MAAAIYVVNREFGYLSHSLTNNQKLSSLKNKNQQICICQRIKEDNIK